MSGKNGETRRRERHVRRDVVEAVVVVSVGDGDIHMVCVWRYINEWWSRHSYDNDLSGEIPSELGKMTKLLEAYVLFTPLPSFHFAHSRALFFLPSARCVPSTFYLLSP